MDDASRKTTASDSFGHRTDNYLDSRTHREGEDLETLASWCEGATRALDVATGAGHTAGALVEAGVPNVVASDASPSMVATGVDSFPSVGGVVADAERLPFADDAFDAATCRIAAHHFPNPEAFLAEVGRVVRPGGTFAFEDNVVPEDDALGSFLDRLEGIRDPTHVESHETATWREWLTDAGFAVEETAHVTKELDFEPWVDRIDELDDERREAVHRLLLDASEEAKDAFAVEVEDGRVQSFENLKALFRAIRTD